MDSSTSAIVEKTILQAKYAQAEPAEPADATNSSVSGSALPGEDSIVAPSTVPGSSSYTSLPEEQGHVDGDESRPPPYSGPSTSSQAVAAQSPRCAKYYPGLPQLDYKLYSPQLFELSQDCTVLSSKAPYLSATATALVNLVRSLSTVPPKPHIHVVGARGRRVDFDIKLNLMSLLVPENPKDRMDYIRCVGDGEIACRGGVKADVIPDVGDGGLDEWCRRFVDDTASVKSFELSRVVANLDTSWLDGQIRSLLATTDYKGVLNITFPVTHARVVVQSPDKLNKFFTSVTTLFAGKHKYEVVQAVWPFATARSGDENRRCIVMTEEMWFNEWRDAIRYSVATKKKGWVSTEEKLLCVMEGKAKGLTFDWGPDL